MKQYRKIDIYLKNLKGFYAYECSTTWARTCKEAKAGYLRGVGKGLDNGQVKTSFSKEIR